MSEYDRDFAAWALKQAQLVAEGRWDELDRENVADELRSIAHCSEDEAYELVRWLLLQLSRWYLRPDLRCGRWASRIMDRRYRLGEILRDSPSLDGAEMVATWSPLVAERVRLRFPNAFPNGCPFTIEQLVDDDYWME